jgi:hypothetical protein
MTDTSVFISYSTGDVDREWIEVFARSLRDRDLHPWLAEWDIKAGDRIADALESALRESDAIVAVISHNVNPNVYFELGLALGTNKRLILVVDPSAARSLPLDLRQRRWIAMQEPERTAREVAEAVGVIG